MMRWLGLVVLLAACAGPEPIAPDGYRDTGVAITSSTRFEATRFRGDWQVIESFDVTPAPVTVRHLSFRPNAVGFAYGEGVEPQPDPTRSLEIGAFGRLTDPKEQRDPIWVLWVDEDHETAVLGTPSGRMGRIVNRASKLRADRLKAAREVLAFNGYDISKLRRVGP